MITLKFCGFSDDTFGEYSATNRDVDNCASGKPIQCKISSGKDALFVVGQYDRNKNGCWDIGISQIDEDMPLPAWPMRFSAEGYTTILEIDVPDDYSLTFYNDGKKVDE